MSTNSDQKTQVSAEIESSVPIPSEAGPVAAKQASAADPAPDLGDLLRKAEDEAAGLKDAWLRARAAGTVVQVFRKGYRLNDRVLRPALVAVAKAREGAASGQAGA